MSKDYQSIESLIGNTPMVRLQRIPVPGRNNRLLLKLEGNNPAGSVKDRAALSMIQGAESRHEIRPGDTIIEATSGNTGIALAMVAAIKGYKMRLIMPDNSSQERVETMRAFGAEVVLVSEEDGMEGARDLALKMESDKEGYILNQFDNHDNSAAHYRGTGPEIWRDTEGEITHFVSAMGTTGTIMGAGRYFREQNSGIQIVGVQPDDEASIPGIRRWPEDYLPKIFDPSGVDLEIDVSQESAEKMTRQLAQKEGIFCGISSGGAVAAALQFAESLTDATIVTIICDRGDRYLSTGVFNKN